MSIGIFRVPTIAINHTAGADWHALRATNVGGSECAALFGLSPFLTKRGLWRRKAGLDEPVESSERMDWGLRLEDAILREAAARFGWRVIVSQQYLSDQEGMGATMDALCATADGETFSLEIKNVDVFQYGRAWRNPGADDEPPIYYQLQAQHQMHLAAGIHQVEKGCIVALVGGNRLAGPFWQDRRPLTGAKIQAAIREFWASIRAGQEPPIEPADLAMLAPDAVDPAKSIDLSGSDDARRLLTEYLNASADVAVFEEKKEEAKAALFSLMGDAAVMVCDGMQAKRTIVAASEGKEITADMVGSRIGARKQSVRLTVRG